MADRSGTERHYIDVYWKHDSSSEPIRLVSALDLRRMEMRKLEFFRDGSVGCASLSKHSAETALGIVPVPEISEINADEQFQAVEMSAQEFDALWKQHGRDCA